MYRHGTSGYGLVGMVVLGGWLDLSILEVFSSLNDSMIYDSMKNVKGTISLLTTLLLILSTQNTYSVCPEKLLS